MTMDTPLRRLALITGGSAIVAMAALSPPAPIRPGRWRHRTPTPDDHRQPQLVHADQHERPDDTGDGAAGLTVAGLTPQRHGDPDVSPGRDGQDLHRPAGGLDPARWEASPM